MHRNFIPTQFRSKRKVTSDGKKLEAKLAAIITSFDGTIILTGEKEY